MLIDLLTCSEKTIDRTSKQIVDDDRVDTGIVANTQLSWLNFFKAALLSLHPARNGEKLKLCDKKEKAYSILTHLFI